LFCPNRPHFAPSIAPSSIRSPIQRGIYLPKSKSNTTPSLRFRPLCQKGKSYTQQRNHLCCTSLSGRIDIGWLLAKNNCHCCTHLHTSFHPPTAAYCQHTPGCWYNPYLRSSRANCLAFRRGNFRRPPHWWPLRLLKISQTDNFDTTKPRKRPRPAGTYPQGRVRGLPRRSQDNNAPAGRCRTPSR
jgi:hypothetical protein